MSAPSNAYLTKSIHTYNNGEVINSRAIVQADKVTLQNRFYLDDLLITRDQDGNEGFTGLVKIGGGNYKYHSTSRIGSLRAYNSGIETNYTDAGLNTLAHAQIDQTFTTHVNYVKVQSTFKSSFYDGSTEHGYYYMGTQDNTWHRLVTSGDYQQPNLSIYPTEVITNAYYYAQNFYYKPFVVNPEGEFIGEQKFITASEAIYQFLGNKRVSPCNRDNEVSTVFWMTQTNYMKLDTDVQQDNATATGIYAYLDPEFTQVLPAGYYGNLNNPTKVYQVDQLGQFIVWNYCAPPEPAKDVNIYLFQMLNQDGSVSYSVSAVLTSAQSFDVNLSGNIVAGNGAIGVGSGSWDITIPAGTFSGSQDTSYQAGFGYDYLVPQVYYINPSSLTYKVNQSQ